MKILESIAYVISQPIYSGGREIVQGGGKVLPKFSPKVSSKLWVNFGSSKVQQNCNNNYDSISDFQQRSNPICYD